eukprot:scaffold375_cov378-Prasinococcus_capsulatus_cf.AAC.17
MGTDSARGSSEKSLVCMVATDVTWMLLAQLSRRQQCVPLWSCVILTSARVHQPEAESGEFDTVCDIHREAALFRD